MYTLEQLQQKNLKELKEIGQQLSVLPDGDRRCRQNWIDALVGVQPPLLQLLETSPGVEVEPVSEAIEVQDQEPLLESSPSAVECPSCGAVHALYSTTEYDYFGRSEIRCVHCNYSRFKNYPGPIQPEPQEPPIEYGRITSYLCHPQPIETPPGVESKFGRIVYPKSAVKSIAQNIEQKVSQSAIVQVLEKSLDVSRKSSAHISVIVPATKNLPRAQSDLNPILTGLTLSDKFLATYLPPNFSADYDAELDGQLKLLDRVTAPEPPDSDDYSTLAQFWAVMNAWNATYTDSVEQFKDWDIPQQNNAEFIGTDTERKGAREVSVIAPATAGRDICSQHDGASIPSHDERLGSQKGDRILEGSRNNSGDCRGVLPHQPPQLTPQAHHNDEHRPPNRGDGRGIELAVGMLVGRRRDRQHVGKILDIYQSKRGIWRAKVQPLNKLNFVYFDCANLIEQKLLYDYEMKPGGFIPTGTIFDKARGESFEVYSRKRSQTATNWTVAKLSSLSTFKLKQIARDMEIFSIPGRTGKRSLIRAILAEQVLRDRSETAAKPAPKSKVKSRWTCEAIGMQLSLDLVVA
ncbi:hypothetical protein [Microcoleus sp. B9-D4]|uniref:hypothetical protein n=1 Tax=Microcoleus sp. B9-D4 TaxID=2818711 RepID=UPI002FD0BE7B